MSKQTDLFGPVAPTEKPVAVAPLTSGRYTYCCANRKCRMHDVEVKHDMTPRQASELPIREIRCQACRNPLLWLGPLEKP